MDRSKVLNSQIIHWLQIGQQIRAVLHNNIPQSTIERILFQDDILWREAQRTSVDNWRRELFLKRWPLQIRQLILEQWVRAEDIRHVSEYSLIPKILKLTKELKHDNIDGIPLFGYRGNMTLPSCEALDTLQYLERLEKSDITITALPRSYIAQQNRVRKILSYLWHNQPNIIVAYFDKEGFVSDMSCWNRSGTLSTTFNNLKHHFNIK
jgi:hypothetical protein